MKQPIENKVYKAALYLRLSKDDGFTDKDSASIETQHEMLTRYCRENNIVIYDYYVDDGYTGRNFDRPAFKHMIEDIENNLVNCVITKDQSRLGRNHLESGFYMEVFFPEHGVRYIAINDNVDTINASTMDIAPFRNLLNDMYSNDISKKVKSALYTRQKQGKFIGVKAPYGYKKDPNDKNHLIVDEKYAPVVRKIFKMYLEDGYGTHTIAKKLTEEKIIRPAVAAAEYISGFEKYIKDDDSVYLWKCEAVAAIIRNPVYAGHIRGQNRPKISIKSEKRKPVGSVAFIVENVHEPLVDPDKWEIAQELLKSRRREKDKDAFDNIFAGIVKCADCGHALTKTSAHRRKPRENRIEMIGYQCNHYREFGKNACTQHWIEAKDLYDAVLEDIRAHARYALENDEKMIADIISKLNSDVSDNTKQAEKELRKSKSRLSELDKLFAALYEDKVAGNITERNYRQLASAYEAEQIQLEKVIAESEEMLRTVKVRNDNADHFVELIKGYAEIEELNATLLHILIDKIVVHSAEVIDGEKTQKIEIYYKFIGKF